MCQRPTDHTLLVKLLNIYVRDNRNIHAPKRAHNHNNTTENKMQNEKKIHKINDTIPKKKTLMPHISSDRQ